jgi:hypothetical protein
MSNGTRQSEADRNFFFPKVRYLSLAVLCGDWPSWLLREAKLYRSTSVQPPHLDEY